MPAAKRTAKSRSNSTRDRCTTAGTGDHGQILGERQEHQAMVDAKYRFMALLWLHQSGRDRFGEPFYPLFIPLRGCYALSLEEEIEVQGKLLCAGKSVGVVYVGFRKKRTGKLMAQARHTEYLAVSSRSRGFPSVVR